ncbi:Trm112 family protein [Alkalisalibacterium limincola]|uniref:Trm112 family protein n=1 Tax=Alkalisalibacterium limincola TaxID=2699169 RepID=A0A5C8KRD8_9GAMM|nr:Trm112 family protein [Alkalisalibacterium limincola]TXK62590.1 Trm112 family protein [Alkalisalibacterium limincola]
MDRRLLDILCCPVTRQPLVPLTGTELESINRGIAQGTVQRTDGSAETAAWSAGLLTGDRKLAYRIEDGIPVLLADEAVSTKQVTDFPR